MPKHSAASISTDREVAGAKQPPEGRSSAEYRIDGTPNLVLRVWSSGKRTWVFWLQRRKTNRWQKYTIGPYPIVTLALARRCAANARAASGMIRTCLLRPICRAKRSAMPSGGSPRRPLLARRWVKLDADPE